jgi:hypothetical protein
MLKTLGEWSGVIGNMLDALSFILLTPQVAGRLKLGRLAARLRRFTEPKARWISRNPKRLVAPFILVWFFCFIMFFFALLFFIFREAFGGGRISESSAAILIWCLLVISITTAVGILIEPTILGLRSIASSRRALAIATMLGIVCFTLGRAFGIWNGWPKPPG